MVVHRERNSASGLVWIGLGGERNRMDLVIDAGCLIVWRCRTSVEVYAPRLGLRVIVVSDVVLRVVGFLVGGLHEVVGVVVHARPGRGWRGIRSGMGWDIVKCRRTGVERDGSRDGGIAR